MKIWGYVFVMANSEKKIKDYILRRTVDTGKLQQSISDIADATNISTATVWRALKSLEEKGIIKIKETQGNNVPNIILPLDTSEISKNELMNQIEDAENLVKLSKTILEHFHDNRVLINQLKKELKMHREWKSNVLKVIPFGKEYEFIVRRKDDAESQRKDNEAIQLAETLSQIYKFNNDNDK